MRQTRRLGDLKGYALFAHDGEIGRIKQVYFDDEQWVVRYFVVHAGGWLLGRDVLIAPRSLTGVDDDNKRIELDLSRAQVENAPPIDSERPVSRHYEIEFHQHFGWPPYWESSIAGAPVPMLPVEPPTGPVSEPDNPHLRDSAEVIGYHLQAEDGELGHVHDLILDDQDWSVRYFVVDTRNWLPGKKVLISPAWISGISWMDRAMSVDLERDLIRSAPAYDPGALISHDDQVRLYAHYGKSALAASEPGQAKHPRR